MKKLKPIYILFPLGMLAALAFTASAFAAEASGGTGGMPLAGLGILPISSNTLSSLPLTISITASPN